MPSKQQVELTVWCLAPDAAFVKKYDQIPEDIRRRIERQRGLPCDGGGVPGSHCLTGRQHGCMWHYVVEEVLTDAEPTAEATAL